MSILKIQTGVDNLILRKKAREVREINPQIKKLISNMTKTMESNQGVGLAAPQIGRLLQIIIVKPNPNKKALVLINPQIKKRSFLKKTAEEGCLSLPGTCLFIKRPRSVVVNYLDTNNKSVQLKVNKLLARVIQHEIDHLDGILITDYAK